MLKKVILILLVSVFIIDASPKNPKGNLSGKLLDQETLSPLPGANILIQGTNIGTTTDENGEYFFQNLSAGTYAINFSYLGFETVTKTDIIIKPGRTVYLDVQIKSSTVEIENVVVESGYFTEIESKPVSTINFSSEEIRRAPGSAGDVSRILFGLPSIAKVNDQYNSLIVRGGTPVENSFYVDNIEIPNINHFPVQGSSDGPISLLNVDFVEDVNFYSGGFSSIYGDKLSSIMELQFREGNKKKFEPQINMSLAGMGGAVEGPIGNSGSYLISANRSYLDLVLDEIESGGALPQYYDAQAKIVYNLGENDKISILDIFSIDNIEMKYDGAFETDNNVYGKTDGITNVIGLNWQHIWSDKGYSNTSISHVYQNFERDFFETKSKNRLTNNISDENHIKLRNVNYLKLNKTNSFEFGFEGTYIFNKYDYVFEPWQDNFGNISKKLVVDKDMKTFKTGFFGVHHLQLLENFRVDIGARADYFEETDAFNFSPRLSLTYNLNKKTSISASAGIFYQDMPNYLLSQNDEFKKLKTPSSRHYVLGFSRQIGESTRLTIETYYKDYENFPIDPDQPNVFLFDQVSRMGLFLSHDNLVDNGKANSKGVEVILQKKLAKDFYGMISGSFSKSKYTDLNGTTYDRIYDNRFNFTFEGGYVPNEEWEFKLRWIYAGGAPYTPYDFAKSKESNRGTYDLTKINSKRLPDYHSLNIRIDKRFLFNGSNLILFLSVWNAYGRENVAQYTWNEIKNEPDVQNMWSTLPVIGLEYEF